MEEKRRKDKREAAMAAAAQTAAQQQSSTGASASSPSAPSSSPSPLTQSTSWIPPIPSVSPSALLTKRQVEVLKAAYTQVTALLMQSHYHFIPPTVFHTQAGKRTTKV